MPIAGGDHFGGMPEPTASGKSATTELWSNCELLTLVETTKAIDR
jgi:hypothetical protein